MIPPLYYTVITRVHTCSRPLRRAILTDAGHILHRLSHGHLDRLPVSASAAYHLSLRRTA